MHSTTLATLAAAVASAQAATIGFNYASTFTDGTAKAQSDFEAEFTAAKDLAGTSGEFTSARLYTMIQGSTDSTPISAISAAIDTQTTLLLGLWASGGQTGMTNEILALTTAITNYGTDFTDLIIGISVGSEDLYRTSVVGIENDSGVGAYPATLVDYIAQVRTAIEGTSASGAAIGHVDTWNDWTNTSNSAVIEACDWIGMDAYPYFENTLTNGIDDADTLFFDAYEATLAVAGSKDVWVTETGWPVSGSKENLAVASVANAETYWQAVACSLFADDINTWWYILDDSLPTTPSPSFGIITSLTGSPLYDLTCNSSSSSSSSSSASSSTSSSATSVSTSAASATATASAYGSTTASSSQATAASESVSSTASVATSATSAASDASTFTTTLTTRSTVTVCPSTCSTSATSLSSVSSAASVSVSTSSTSSAATSSSSSCPTNLDGTYQYPHLIIPVSSTEPTTAIGTQYNATINSTTSTIFNFDIPAAYSGETCSLVFLFPLQAALETSAWTFNGEGGITVNQLSEAATEETTYDTVPTVSTADIGSIASLTAGNGYVITTMSCPAGDRISYEFVSTGGLALEFFEDWNPSPLGAFITTC